jgi:hypothetical protein
VRPPCLGKISSRIGGWGCLTAILLGIAGFCDPNFAAAADARGGGAAQRVDVDRADRTVPPAARRGIVTRRSEVPPGGVVVLRGSRPANPNVGPPPFGVNGEGYGSTANGTPDIGPTPYTGGLGNVGGFDFSGLSPPAGVFILGQ